MRFENLFERVPITRSRGGLCASSITCEERWKSLVGKLEITSDSVKAESSRNLSKDEKENYEEAESC